MDEPIRIELPTTPLVAPVNTFLIKGPEPVLIDCGMYTPKAWKALKEGLKENGLKLKDLKKVIITHAHVDHLGMAGKIANACDAEIWVNDQCYPFVMDYDKIWAERVALIEQEVANFLPQDDKKKNAAKAFTKFLKGGAKYWTTIPPDRVRRYASNGSLVMGGKKWESIYMPGHSTTQTCFYQEELKWFIAADALLPLTATPAIEPSLEDITKRAISLPVMINSLRFIKSLEIEKVFPGHGPIFTHHRSLIDYQLNRIQERKEEVYELIKSGTQRFIEIFNVLYEKQINIMGVSMLVGYLDLLLIEDRIEQRMIKGYAAFFLK